MATVLTHDLRVSEVHGHRGTVSSKSLEVIAPYVEGRWTGNEYMPQGGRSMITQALRQCRNVRAGTSRRQRERRRACHPGGDDLPLLGVGASSRGDDSLPSQRSPAVGNGSRCCPALWCG